MSGDLLLMSSLDILGHTRIRVLGILMVPASDWRMLLG